jgi:hypothetical protein
MEKYFKKCYAYLMGFLKIILSGIEMTLSNIQKGNAARVE